MTRQRKRVAGPCRASVQPCVCVWFYHLLSTPRPSCPSPDRSTVTAVCVPDIRVILSVVEPRPWPALRTGRVCVCACTRCGFSALCLFSTPGAGLDATSPPPLDPQSLIRTGPVPQQSPVARVLCHTSMPQAGCLPRDSQRHWPTHPFGRLLSERVFLS